MTPSSVTFNRLKTKLTNLLGIQTPIVSAPMAGASGGRLAAQVTLGGGFGFMAAGYDTVENFESELQIARSALSLGSADKLPIGVGFLCWQLEKANSPGPNLLSIALTNRVQAVWLSFGNHLDRWVQHVRDFDQKTERHTIIFIQVTSLEEATLAYADWKPDVIVVQGIEAGGHGSSSSPPLLSFVPSVLSISPSNGPPILAAGGLSNGAHIASLLALGADGVVVGTRFLLTPESLYTDAQRQALVGAGLTASVRTMAFDHVRNTLGWPTGIDGRALRNFTVDEFEKGEDLSLLRQRFEEGVRKGDPTRMLVWAGTGVGLMNEIMPAKAVVEQLHFECVQRIQVISVLPC